MNSGFVHVEGFDYMYTVICMFKQETDHVGLILIHFLHKGVNIVSRYFDEMPTLS